MGRDASLDEFLGDGDAESEDDSGDESGHDSATGPDVGTGIDPDDEIDEPRSGVDVEDDAVDAESADDERDRGAPAGGDDEDTGGGDALATFENCVERSATSRWDPVGEPCADCGASVRRRWGSEAGFVCAECASW